MCNTPTVLNCDPSHYFVYLFTFFVVLLPQFFHFEDECLTLNRGKSIRKTKGENKAFDQFPNNTINIINNSIPNKKVLTINIKGFRIMISKSLEFSSKHSKLTRACKNVWHTIFGQAFGK